MFTLYILKSKKNGRYYIGHTNNFLRRFAEHNSGQTRSTKPHRPWEVVFTQQFTSKSEAATEEFRLKY